MLKGRKPNILLLQETGGESSPVLERLRKAGLDFSPRQCGSEKDFVTELASSASDLILADYEFKDMGAVCAFKTARVFQPGSPFIFFNWRREDRVAEEIKNSEEARGGRNFFFLKDQLDEMVFAVKEALMEKSLCVPLPVTEKFEPGAYDKTFGESALFTNNILEAIGEPISIQDPEMRIVFQNHPHIDMFGPHTGEYCYSALRGREQICYDCSVIKSFKDGGVHRHASALEKGGEKIELEIVSSPLTDAEGRVYGCLELLHDVSREKRTEKEARFKDEYLSNVLSSIEEAVFSLDTRTQTIIECNRAVADIFGYGREELAGQHLSKLFRDRDIYNQTIRALLGSFDGEASMDTAAEFKRSDGDVFEAVITFKELANVEDTSGRLLLFVKDISREKQVEASREEYKRALNILRLCTRAVSESRDEKEMLEDICGIMAREGGYLLVWVGMAVSDRTKAIKPVASGGREVSYLENIKVSWSKSKNGRGPAGTAVREGRPVLIQDITLDTHFIPWVEHARKHEFASIAAFPVFRDSETVGAMLFYSNETNSFDTDEVQLLGDVVDTVSHGLTAIREKAENHEDLVRLTEQEERLRMLAENIQDVFWVTSADMSCLHYVSPAYEFYWAREVETVYEDPSSMFEAIHPEDRPRAEKNLRNMGRKELVFNYRLRKPDGSIIWVCDRRFPVFDRQRNVKCVIGITSDITDRILVEQELEHTNRILHGISECNQILIRTQEEEELLQRICETIVSVMGYRFCWVGYAENDERKTVRPVRFAGYEEGYLENIDITWSDEPSGQGPTGSAIKTGSHYVLRHLGEKEFDPWRNEAARRGYGSAIALPLISEGRTFGALNIYAHDPDSFDEKEIGFLGELAEDLSFGIVSIRNEKRRQDAESALKENEALLSHVLESLPVGVWILDKNGTIIHGNPAGHQIWQGAKYVGPENYGQYKGWWVDSGELLGAEDWAAYKAIKYGETILDEEVEIECFDGSHKIILNSAMPIRTDDSERLGAIIVNQDITQRKVMEKQLQAHAEILEETVVERTKELSHEKERAEEANKAKSNFLANMSHELRTPLNSIIGFAEVVRDGMTGPVTEGQQEYLNDIWESGKHLLRLINDILDLSKIESAQIEFEFTRISMKELIDNSLFLFKEKAMRHNIKLSTEVAEGLPDIQADERRIKQVLFNLVSNAMKFTPDGGMVCVSAEPWESGVLCRVTDTGIGIAKKDYHKLFQPFQQLHSGTEKNYEGSGLGLNLSKTIVERHGGNIWVEDSEERSGTTFAFTLPKDPPRGGGALV